MTVFEGARSLQQMGGVDGEGGVGGLVNGEPEQVYVKGASSINNLDKVFRHEREGRREDEKNILPSRKAK